MMKMSKFNEIGRSMVEMLGVLAIIGVLSIGAIAGYSKAMMKYKLNKHAEGFNLFLTQVMQLSKQLPEDTGYTIYTDLVLKLNLLPDGIIHKVNNYLGDDFGYVFWFYRTSQNSWGIQYTLTQDSNYLPVCQNLFNIAREHHEFLQTLHHEMSTGTGGSNNPTSGYYYGKDCHLHPNKCIKDLTNDDIYNLCSSKYKPDDIDDTKRYLFTITW